jgi:hypothetical protein
LEVTFHVTDFKLPSSIIQVTLQIKSTETTDEALTQYSAAIEQQYSLAPGTVKKAITRAVPYLPAFTGFDSGNPSFYVAQPAPDNMLVGDIFKKEGGTYVIDVDPGLSKLILAQRVGSKKKKNRRKNKRKTPNEGEENDPENNAPGVDDGDDADTVSVSSVQSSSYLAEVQKMIADVHKAMEVERKVAAEDREKTSKLEKAMEEERQKTSKLEKAMKDEREKTSKLEKAMADEREMTSKLNQTVEEEREKVRKLKVELGVVKETTDDTTEWILTGCLGDSEALRRIKIRTLLDRVQALLAYLVGITPQRYTRQASALWRGTVIGSTPAERLKSIQDLLQSALRGRAHADPMHSALRQFMESTNAMALVVEENSKLREDGDKAAHYNFPKSKFIAVVDEHCKAGGPHGEGLKAFVEFLFP